MNVWVVCLCVGLSYVQSISLTLQPIAPDTDPTSDTTLTISNWKRWSGRRVWCTQWLPSKIHSVEYKTRRCSAFDHTFTALFDFNLRVDWRFGCIQPRQSICRHSKWAHNCPARSLFYGSPNWDNCWFHSWMKWPTLVRPVLYENKFSIFVIRDIWFNRLTFRTNCVPSLLINSWAYRMSLMNSLRASSNELRLNFKFSDNRRDSMSISFVCWVIGVTRFSWYVRRCNAWFFKLMRTSPASVPGEILSAVSINFRAISFKSRCVISSFNCQMRRYTR